MKNKKILIVGNLYALTKFISTKVEKVYVAPGNSMMSEFAECIDIREDNPEELLKFVVDNDIDLTVAVSKKAILSGISDVFQANGELIFAPSAKSAEFAIYKSAAKRFLYKLRVPTPRFGIFEKLPLALDYLKEVSYPLIIKSDCDDSVMSCCCTYEHAKVFVEDLFLCGERKVIIEEYLYGNRFTMYVVTDGYHAIPLTTVRNYNFSDSCNGGIFTSGVGAYVPDYKVSIDVQNEIFKNVFLNVINSLERKSVPYMGILGADIILTENGYSVIEFKPFFQNIDCQAVLNCIDEDLIELFEACANGFFADEYEDILMNDNVSVSCLVSSRKEQVVIPNVENLDSEVSFLNVQKNKYFEYVSSKGNNLVLTACAKTFSRAKQILSEDLSHIMFESMKYRKDICE